jgi:putative ABC transport system permease protein
MLKLKNITKEYPVPGDKVVALSDVSLSFRKSEFVAVLGPSGCGKTTLLNIIGGLDRYTSGDLVIGGVSTKKYTDRDWDNYRNHSIGFVFQSYNLIPHQTILGNVELALTIAGVSKAERIERAKAALDKVGLGGQYYKRPNQLSGGQMQRVAIARALVNDPEIILADEPTGALDTKTSTQVMDLLKEVARDRLVIMVTHNPDLAEQYSTRIIRLLDGAVIDDTMPYSEADEDLERAEPSAQPATAESKADNKASEERKSKKKERKAKMSFFTSFRLSAQNLWTKRARSVLTSIAGAIGIIGVSLVLAMSFGVRTYINDMQNDMLSGNPIKISQSTFDMNSLMSKMTRAEKAEVIRENGFVNIDSMVDNLVEKSKNAESLIIKNTITKDYMDYVAGLSKKDAAAVFFDYNLDVGANIFTDFTSDKGFTHADGEDYVSETKTLSLSTIRALYISILETTSFEDYASYITTIVDNFRQCPADENYVLDQYDVLYGKVADPTKKDEVMIVLSDESKLTDILLAQLGYYGQSEFLHHVYAAEPTRFAEMEEYYADATLERTKFSYDELMGKTFTWYPNDVVFKDPAVTTTMGRSSFSSGYNYEATDEFSDGVQLRVVGILQPKKGISYGCMESGFYYTEALTKYIIDTNINSEIVSVLKDAELDSVYSGDNYARLHTGVSFNYSYVYKGEQVDETGYVGSPNSTAAIFSAFSTIMGGGSGSSETYVLTVQNLGGSSVAHTISVYPVDFDRKANVLAYLDKWNENGDVTIISQDTGETKTLSSDQREQITYTDNLSLVINMINEFIQIVTIALIGFTALSLVVSSFMIAIITYVSVVERVKEIGVIRSLGGRKKDVSRLFTAETFIIGLASGIFGILITYLLSLVINLIVASLSPISTIAILPWYDALIMIVISVLLTLISGVFPASAAAKKDPVVALRTE